MIKSALAASLLGLAVGQVFAQAAPAPAAAPAWQQGRSGDMATSWCPAA